MSKGDWMVQTGENKSLRVATKYWGGKLHFFTALTEYLKVEYVQKHQGCTSVTCNECQSNGDPETSKSDKTRPMSFKG